MSHIDNRSDRVKPYYQAIWRYVSDGCHGPSLDSLFQNEIDKHRNRFPRASGQVFGIDFEHAFECQIQNHVS
jgi:hypothetical protein